MAEPLFEIAHLASVELLSPRRTDSVAFFRDLLGMYVVHTEANATYLRGYEDPYAYSLKISDADGPGPGISSFRANSAEALERRAKALEAKGLGDGWIDRDFGHGRAFLFHTPDGHPMKLLWDVDYAKVAEADRTLLRNRPSKRPSHGVPVRRLDHVNYLCSDVTANKDALIEALGFRLAEHVVLDAGVELAAWLRVSNLVHDMAFMKDAAEARGRLHHVAFWYGIPQHLMDIGELCAENGIKIEAGPAKHGISQALFLYLFEPGGNRIELFGDSGYLIFDPTWKAVRWADADLAQGLVWVGGALPQDFFVYGTPIVEAAKVAAAAE